MLVLQRVSFVVVVALLLVVVAACGQSDHPDNPQKQAFVGRDVHSGDTPRRGVDGSIPSRDAAPRPSYRAPRPTPTTTTGVPVSVTAVPVTRPQIVIPPRPQQGPTPVSSRRCSGAIETEIEAVFGTAGPWASSVAWRESNCIPTARNGQSGSAGLFQLFRHDDLLAAVCPQLSPQVSWANPDCNIRAAFALYQGSGVGPWAL